MSRPLAPAAFGFIGTLIAGAQIQAGHWAAFGALSLMSVGLIVTALAALTPSERGRRLTAEAGLSTEAVGAALLLLQSDRETWVVAGAFLISLHVLWQAVRLVKYPPGAGGFARHELRLIFWIVLPSLTLLAPVLAALAGAQTELASAALAAQCLFVAVAPLVGGNLRIKPVPTLPTIGILTLTLSASLIAMLGGGGAPTAFIVALAAASSGYVALAPHSSEEGAPGTPIRQAIPVVIGGWVLAVGALFLVIVAGVVRR